MKQGRIIALTGSPGTGRTTTSAIVARESGIIEELARALGVSIAELLTGEHKKYLKGAENGPECIIFF